MFEKLGHFFHKKPQELMQDDDIRELSGTHVAILATDGFEESELFEPKEALERAGVQVHIVSLKAGKIRSWEK